MPIVQSYGTLQTVASALWGRTSVNMPPPQGLGGGYAYGMLYATQPNVRTCVDFLARNIAQLGYHVFKRVSDTDRQRLANHQLAQWIENPNPYTTRYRLFESLIADLALYFNAFWLKVRLLDRIGLVRVPPPLMWPEGGLLPVNFRMMAAGETQTIATTEVVYFNGYNPLNALAGLSPLDTLRRTLEQDIAAMENREAFWRNSSRMEGIIERPKDAPRWTPQQKQHWREQWQQRYAGPQGAGTIAVLEDGMSWKQTSWSARDSEYVASKKLSREECAAAYHIPLPMVGILEHATFSNIKEQHKQLYADCLGPWLEMVASAIELQLLPECRQTTNIYTEFNISEKLRGSFEEQANALRVLVGRPVMTANEGRARLNLPKIIDDVTADQLAPQQGGPSQAGEPAVETGTSAQWTEVRQQSAAIRAALAETDRELLAPVVREHWARLASRLTRVPAPDRADAFLGAPQRRFRRELLVDLEPLAGDVREDLSGFADKVIDVTIAALRAGDELVTLEVPLCDAMV